VRSWGGTLLNLFQGVFGNILGGAQGLIGMISNLFAGFGGGGGGGGGFGWVGTALQVVSLFLADGALATRPVNAMIGEAGPELVLPADRINDLATVLRPGVSVQEVARELHLPQLGEGGLALEPMNVTLAERGQPELVIPANRLEDVATVVHPGMNPFELATTLNLPRLAGGGVVDRPTVALLGEGGEGEVVAPLSRLREEFEGASKLEVSVVNNVRGINVKARQARGPSGREVLQLLVTQSLMDQFQRGGPVRSHMAQSGVGSAPTQR
jgi:hypothetical protein